ncbi:MAG: STAS domain-containing protein [Candidatus Zixiibacteriota bacterium]
MKITVKDEGAAKIVSLDGRLDLATGGELKEEIKKHCEGGTRRIHLNLQKVDFINSSGLGAMVSVMKQVRSKKGKLTLSNLAPHVREIFDITQLSHVFEIYDTQNEAMASPDKVAAD